MDYYGHVYFGPDEKERQRKFLETMNSAGIIQLSDEELDRIYKDDISTPKFGCDNHFVLHGEEEKKRFGYVMDAFFSDKKYNLTEEPASKEFKEWLDKKNALKTSPLMRKEVDSNESNLS